MTIYICGHIYTVYTVLMTLIKYIMGTLIIYYNFYIHVQVQAYKVFLKMWKYKYNIYTVCCMHTSYCMFMHDT